MPPFTPQWNALGREADIAAQSISAGLGTLRRANYAQTGFYSHAFFSLSIGLERLLKLIFLIDHALQNGGAFPSEGDLRNSFGHDLEKLFAHAMAVHRRMPKPDERYELPPGDLAFEVLRFLAAFAKTTRYYNLAYLTRGKTLG